MDKAIVLAKINFRSFYQDALPSLKVTSKAEAIGLCPFHDDHDPSFGVNLATGLWRCYAGCGGGDVFGFLQRRDGLTFRRAVEALAHWCGEAQPKPRTPLRSYLWVDAAGREAWKLRWNTEEPGRKCTWAEDPDNRRPGKGQCRPTLYRLDEVLAATEVILVEGERDAETINQWLDELARPIIRATCTPNGAGDVKNEYLAPLKGKARVWVSGDNDEAGQRYLQRCGAQVQGIVSETISLLCPQDFKDWTAWQEGGGTASKFESLLIEQAEPFVFVSSPKTGPPHETNFPVVPIDDFLDVPPDQDHADWILEDYLPAGGLVLIAGKPKEGKTTLCYELAVKVAKGLPFLGRTTKRSGVLILGLEEHPRDMRQRLRTLGADGTNLFVYSGSSLHPTPDTMGQVKQVVAANGIKLVLIDTLSAFWTVSDENDAAGVQKAIQPILGLARESGACVLLIHHARKSEGSYGDEIRGSGALFAAVDVALILKRHEIHNQRKLNANSRYSETPVELVIELRDGGYVSLGDPAKVARQAKRDKMMGALTSEPMEAKVLAQRAGVPQRDAYRLLDELHKSHEAHRSGEGRKKDPYRYCHNSFRATPRVLGSGPHETNSRQAEFDSCAPRPPA
jgi:putative DNA primase/helicase